ncbi:MAG TPA: polysaccharide deacetylase [Ktedonobacterales bacterium]|nr:polysaccharide deacetylase [Ktedonobacterales bacterium]
MSQNLPRHLVCLTFDFDALSLWIARGMTSPTPISQGEFGAVGAERILELLAAHAIPATWFIPGHTIETYPDLCARIHSAGHEIGHHGYAHEAPVGLTREAEEAILARGNEVIRGLTGATATGYRSPAWDLSPHSVDLLLAHGFTYDSSMMANDYTPYYARHGDATPLDQPAQLGEPTSLIEMPVSWSLDDFPHFEYLWTATHLQGGLRRAEDVLANWLDDFRYMARTVEWGALTLTFHPQVIGRGHRMLMLERLIEALEGMGATFARMDSVAQEFAQRSPFPGMS